MSHRKDYRALADEKLDILKADAEAILGSSLGQLTLPAKIVYWLVMEVIDSREEIFRLQLCQTVDQILSDELDDEDDLLTIRWPDNPYLDYDMKDSIRIHKPASSRERTALLPRQPEPTKPSPNDKGRRIRRTGL